MHFSQTPMTLHLYKQNFKFSSAHFLIFDKNRAERLHGHNYQVAVDIKAGAESCSRDGYLIDFRVLKEIIKEKLDRWDERVLLPQKHPEVFVQENGKSLEVRFRERFYVFPKDEVVLLPILNTSVELLSQHLARLLFSDLKKHGISRIRVRVEETRGQGASSVAGPS